MSKVLLDVQDLKLHYPVKVGKGIRRETKYVKAVDGISFQVMEGETFGIVGESGCGKSTTGKVLVRLLKPTAGSVLYDGKDIFSASTKAENLELCRKIQIIFQDPYSSLDPRFSVGNCIAEPLSVHKIGTSQENKAKALSLMQDVGLREDQFNRYPHEFSGGQRQRIGIARALALNPSLIVCDEPVSALDVSIQAQILNMMKDLQKKYNLTYIFISHNLSVVKHICDRIAVMYLGNIVEIADKKSLFNNPVHPYTNALLDAIPIPDPTINCLQEPLEGDVPSPMNPPAGCCFHNRCKHATELCEQKKPQKTEISEGHFVVCHYAEELNNKR